MPPTPFQFQALLPLRVLPILDALSRARQPQLRVVPFLRLFKATSVSPPQSQEQIQRVPPNLVLRGLRLCTTKRQYLFPTRSFSRVALQELFLRQPQLLVCPDFTLAMTLTVSTPQVHRNRARDFPSRCRGAPSNTVRRPKRWPGLNFVRTSISKPLSCTPIPSTEII